MALHLRALLCLIAIIATPPLLSQELLPVDSLVQVPKGLETSIHQNIGSLDKKLTRQSEKYLRDFAKQEEKLLKALSKTDSGAAAVMLQSGKATYEKLSKGLLEANTQTEKLLSGEYIASLDSLQGMLGFLKDAKNLVSRSKDIQQQLGSSLQQVNKLQHKLSEASNIQQVIHQRQAALQQLLGSYTNLPKDVSKYFGKYQQQVFYYGQQVREYKEALNDPDKLVRKALEVLRAVPAFQSFMQKNSLLASLFPTPENYGTPQALNGLQTRTAVQQQLLQRLPSGATNGGDPAQYLQQQMLQAQGELDKLKDQLDKLGIKGGGSSDMPMPDFKPNHQKTKSFLQRLDFTSNFQTQRSNQYYPVRTDISINIGYKFSDKAVAGIGLAGRMGWGDSWQKIRLSSQGGGFRSYFDWKAPDLFKTGSRFMSSLWFTAGAELNYNRPIGSLTVFKNYNNWNKSALAGLTKKFSMSSPVKKGRKVEGNMQLLYDFLYKQQIPSTPALVWRVGYGL